MSDLSVLEWSTECWNCGSETTVVWPKNGHLDSDVGETLANADTWNVQRVYSKTQNREVWGNVCVHCDAYQGNHYIEQEAIKQDPPLVECPVCGDTHEWHLDQGMGGAFGQGWIDCPEYGSVPIDDPRTDGEADE